MKESFAALANSLTKKTPYKKTPYKPMIVALARKLLIALWRLVREGIVPDGVVFRAAQ